VNYGRVKTYDFSEPEADDLPFYATVKFYHPDKRYGFAKTDDGSPDVFISFNELDRAGIDTLGAGQRITYQPVPRNGRMRATQIAVVES
jgi:CspA family cold shock protein